MVTDTRSIVCISTMRWDYLSTRKQRFMAHFASRGWRVLYVEPPMSVAAPFLQKDASRGAGLRTELAQSADNLWVLSPGLGAPGAGGRAPFLQDLRYRTHYARVKSALAKLNFDPTVHWTYTPETQPYLGSLGERFSVFDSVDDSAEYPGVNRERIARLEAALARDANLVITTAKGLFDRWSQLNGNVALVPNGFDPLLLEDPSRSAVELCDVVVRARERLGAVPLVTFVGGIYDWIDLDLLAAVALRNSDVGFVLAGPYGKRLASHPIVDSSNVFVAGRVPVADVRLLLAASAVCVNAFVPSELSRHVSPLKVFEYLGAGRPVVTTSMPELAPLSDVVRTADDADAYSAALRAALREDTVAAREARREAVRGRDWVSLCARVEELLTELVDA